jgi:hypothetical protein
MENEIKLTVATTIFLMVNNNLGAQTVPPFHEVKNIDIKDLSKYTIDIKYNKFRALAEIKVYQFKKLISTYFVSVNFAAINGLKIPGVFKITDIKGKNERVTTLPYFLTTNEFTNKLLINNSKNETSVKKNNSN